MSFLYTFFFAPACLVGSVICSKRQANGSFPLKLDFFLL